MGFQHDSKAVFAPDGGESGNRIQRLGALVPSSGWGR
jgi:hypothetical protein